MRQVLKLHADSVCEAVSAIEVDVARPAPNELALTYRLTGVIAGLVLPAQAAPARTDELWRHSCFEAFVQPKGGEGYFEVNLAPSTRWAAYRFDGYRQGMAPALGDPGIAVTTGAQSLEVRAALTLAEAASAPWRVGISAVIEEAGGRISYWALAHPPGRPDFHHDAGFVVELSP
jgi:hypothetical protein